MFLCQPHIRGQGFLPFTKRKENRRKSRNHLQSYRHLHKAPRVYKQLKIFFDFIKNNFHLPLYLCSNVSYCAKNSFTFTGCVRKKKKKNKKKSLAARWVSKKIGQSKKQCPNLSHTRSARALFGKYVTYSFNKIVKASTYIIESNTTNACSMFKGVVTLALIHFNFIIDILHLAFFPKIK